MRMKSRKLSEVHQIEVTTICNLRCKYCPHPKMQRPKVHMEWDTYRRAIEFAKPFYEMGTQNELSLTGIGESTMHPDFILMLKVARTAFPTLQIGFSTNGMPTFTEDIAKACADNKINVFVSLHRPEVAGRAIELAKKHGVFATYNPGAAVSSMNWAGQVDWFVSAPTTICAYLALGWGVVLVDGSVTTCCLDAENKGIIGTVWDDPLSLEVKPYSLCETCHEQVPTEQDLLLHPKKVFVPWGT
jgi:hypothetical protein